MSEDTFSVYYRESIASDPALVASGLSYDEAQDLCLFFSHTVDCYSERNYQGIPIQIGLYFEEE